MAESTLQVRIPEPLLQLGLDQDEIERRVTDWLVISLFSEGRISSGKAARLLHLSRVEFLALLRKHGVAYLNYTADELAEEIAAAEKLQVEATP